MAVKKSKSAKQAMPSSIQITWKPQERQWRFLRMCGLAHPFPEFGGNKGAKNPKKPCRPVAKMVGYGGAAGGGKTDALLMVALIAGLTFPGINIGYFRREFPTLTGPGGAILRSKQLISEDWAKWHDTLKRWTLPTGSILQFCHAQKENDVEKYKSQQFDVVLIDEATEFTRSMVRYLLTRNRSSSNSGIVPFVAMATNPGGLGHSWFKKEFVDAGEPEKVQDVEVEAGRFEKHIFVPARLTDNQKLLSRDPEYLTNLENQPEVIRKQLLDGDWNVFAGQYFKEFSESTHVVKAFPIPAEWPRFRSMDWGYTDPAAVYWHALELINGEFIRVHTYRELYTPGLRASELAEKVIEMTHDEIIEYTVASPDIWARRGNDGLHGETIAETIENGGLYLSKADNKRIPGWNRMREWLSSAPDGKPYWIIHDTCLELIRTMGELIHDNINVEDVHRNSEDHGPESCRYFFMSRPEPGAGDSFMPGGLPGQRGRYRDDEDDDASDKVSFYAM